MSSPIRFLFDKDFAAPPPEAPAEPPVPTLTVPEHEALLINAEKIARAKGFDEGRQATEAKAALRLADEAARLAAAAQTLLTTLDEERARMETEALRLAEIVGRKLAGRLIEVYPGEGVLGLFEEAFHSFRRAAHVVVRLAGNDAASLGPVLEKAAQERGFDGRLVIMEDRTILKGDCRIEWASGAISTDRAALEAEIQAMVERHIALNNATDDSHATKSHDGEAQ